MNTEEKQKVEFIWTRLERLAKLTTLAYESQTSMDLESFLKDTVEFTVPSHLHKLKFVIDILSEMIRCNVFGFPLSEEKTDEFKSEILNNIDILFAPAESEDQSTKYDTRIILITLQFRKDAAALALKWEKDGGDLEEFLEKNVRCQCGNCNPYNGVGQLIFETVREMVYVSLEKRPATDDEVSGWLKNTTKISELLILKHFVKNVNLN